MKQDKTKNKKPLVSVYMPVYNAQDYVAEAIESVLAQNYENLELIIVDDASTDDSAKIIRAYKRKYPKKITAIYLKDNVNMGGDAAGNIAFQHAHGVYIARMDADDVAVPERIAKQVAFLESHPSYAVVGSNAWVIDKQGDIVGEKLVPEKHQHIYDEFFVFHPIIHPTVMIRRKALNGRKDLYRLEYEANNDYLTFMELISKGYRFGNLQDKLLYYRVHGQNDSLVEVKSRFVNSLRIRLRAMFEFGYNPTPMAMIQLIAQVFVVAVLPERAIVPLYMLTRGITSIRDYVPEWRVPGLSRLKRAFVWRS